MHRILVITLLYFISRRILKHKGDKLSEKSFMFIISLAKNPLVYVTGLFVRKWRRRTANQFSEGDDNIPMHVVERLQFLC